MSEHETILRGVDPSRDADYQDDREQHRRNLGRALEYARAYAGTSGGAGASVWDYAALTRAALGDGAFRELDAGQFAGAIAAGRLGPDIGRNEHTVYVDCARRRAIKLTKEGKFGARSNLPGYLRRLETVNRYLDDDLRFEGVIFDAPTGRLRVVVSQPFIVGRPATGDEIARYFQAKGFERFTARSWWHGGFEVLFSDAESHNVLTGLDGRVYPIDLIPETELSPNRIQQIERGVEGYQRIQQNTLEAEL